MQIRVGQHTIGIDNLRADLTMKRHEWEQFIEDIKRWLESDTPDPERTITLQISPRRRRVR